MPGYKVTTMGDLVLETVDEITVMDVYDLASEIGKECDKLIGSVGAEPMKDLIKKVIVVLEILEAFSVKNERDTDRLQEMSDKISQLEAEKQTKAENRRKFEKEVESVEDQWRNESRELLQLVNRLQLENQRLMTQGSANGANPSHEIQGDSDAVSDAEKFLKKELDKYKAEMKEYEEEIEEKTTEVEGLQIEIEQYKSKTLDGKRYQRELQGQIRSLCEERTDLMSRIQDQSQEITLLQQELSSFGKSVPKPKQIISEEPEPVPIEVPNKVDTSKTEEEEPPVQGPMPYEPEDAPWKRRDKETGIRKFFRQLFLDPGKTTFPSGPFVPFTTLGMAPGHH